VTVLTYSVSHTGPVSSPEHDSVGHPSTVTVFVQRAGGHGTVDVPRVVQEVRKVQAVEAPKKQTGPIIGSKHPTAQISVAGGVVTVVVAHEICGGGGGGYAEAAIREQVAA